MEIVGLPTIEVPLLRYGQIYIMSSGAPLSTKQYEMTIGNFFPCICVDFITTMANSLGGHGKWAHCKHLYFVLLNVMYCGQTKKFIHFLTWNQNEMQHPTNHVRVVVHE